MSAQRSDIADEGQADRLPDRLRADGVTIGYDARVISADLSVDIPDNEFTVIIGPNACGKSTLLRSLARMLSPSAGTILLDGRAISSYPSKEVARRLGLLPQSSVAPDGITVADLVARGRYPHQKLLRQWSRTDEEIVGEALAATNVADLADRSVDELSGGQRQRVWIAMALAQETGVLLLDEPTTFLDVTHQIEVLDLLTDLNRASGTTIVMVLHDVNLAARYADHIFALREGRLIASGAPGDVLTRTLIRDVYELDSLVIPDPVSGAPMVLPRGRHHVRDAAFAITPLPPTDPTEQAG